MKNTTPAADLEYALAPLTPSEKKFTDLEKMLLSLVYATSEIDDLEFDLGEAHDLIQRSGVSVDIALKAAYRFSHPEIVRRRPDLGLSLWGNPSQAGR